MGGPDVISDQNGKAEMNTTRRLNAGFFTLGLILLAGLLPNLAFTQFQVLSWDNFENGIMPTTLARGHDATSDTIRLVDFLSPEAPPGILDGIARTECGRYGLVFETDDAHRFLSLASPIALDRKQLGERGKALIQADIYIPDNDPNIPSMAVLATAPKEPDKREIWQFYRLGFLGGDKIYFSFTNKESQPTIYVHEFVDKASLKIPGWHRFQIIFDGQEKIICAVDGKATKFSPVPEPTLTLLQAGLMVTKAVDKKGSRAYVDNLSIQWTTEDVPLPDSPWATPVATATPPPAFPAAPGFAAPAPTPATLEWMTSPEDAWTRCLQEQRPMLIMFFAPRANTYQRLEQIITADPSAQTLVNQFVPLKIDVNQLRGGTIAKQFIVFKVPTFVVIDPLQKERARVLFETNSTWQTVAPELQKALTP